MHLCEIYLKCWTVSYFNGSIDMKNMDDVLQLRSTFIRTQQKFNNI